MFYEIPVAKPWTREAEFNAYRDTIEQVKLGDQMGFHSFWTVEHHFLDEYSHCSNPEVLYGNIAAVTENIRIGYGVRLLPKPYNHPVRTAESVAVLDLISEIVAPDERELRAGLLGTQLHGLLMGRYLLRVPSLTAPAIDMLAAAVAPAIDHYLTGDLGQPRACGAG